MTELVLAISPRVEERIAQRAGGVARRTPGAPCDVKHAAALGVATPTVDERFGYLGGDERFKAGLDAGTDQRAGSTEDQCGRYATTVSDPTRRQHGSRRYQVNDRGHERQGGAAATMPTGFAALRDDHISADIERALCLVEIGNLDDQRDPRIADPLGESSRVTRRRTSSRRADAPAPGPHASVDVVVSAFEDWPLPKDPFDALCAFTAWHWLDLDVRTIKAAAALRRRCQQDIAYTTSSYLDVLRTYSGHRALHPDRRQRLLTCVAELIDHKYGGTIVKRYLYELRVARKCPPEAHGYPDVRPVS